MACINPIKILNPTRTYRPLQSKVFVTVPCGECPDCRASKSGEWFVRTKQEIEDCLHSNGVCVFFTLTYNRRSLPHFHTVDENGTLVDFPCFSHDHIAKFHKDIRRHFEHHGVGKGSFYSIVCCEYGNDRDYICNKDGTIKHSTMAPHYHGLAFFSREAVQDLRDKGYQSEEYVRIQGQKHKVKATVQRKFRTPEDMKKFFEKFWPHGFIRWSKSEPVGHGIFVNSEFAGTYVTKYVNKDLQFYSRPDVKKYIFSADGSINKDHYEKCKRCLPKHWQRQGFGIGLCNKVLQDPIRSFTDGIHFPELDPKHLMQERIKQGKKSLYMVPRYIERKLLYDFNRDTNEYILNDLGREVKTALFERKVNSFAEKLEHDMMPFAFDKYNGHSALEKLGFDTSVKSLSSYLQELRGDATYKEIALFNLVWKGKVATSMDEIEGLDSLDLGEFFAISAQKYVDDLYIPHHFVFDPDGYFKVMRSKRPHEFKRLITFDCCKRFSNFNKIIDVLNDVRAVKRNEQQLAYEKDREERRRLKYELYAS